MKILKTRLAYDQIYHVEKSNDQIYYIENSNIFLLKDLTKTRRPNIHIFLLKRLEYIELEYTE